MEGDNPLIHQLENEIQKVNGVQSVIIIPHLTDEHHLEVRIVLNEIEDITWGIITNIIEQQENLLRITTGNIWFLDACPIYP